VGVELVKEFDGVPYHTGWIIYKEKWSWVLKTFQLIQYEIQIFNIIQHSEKCFTETRTDSST